MANDIGDFFSTQSREDAIFGIANHLRSYWSPRMRAMLTEQLEHGAEGLDELPCEALRFLKDRADFKPIQPQGGDAG
ncbi:MAG TPA: formate dehydrogenase subunit delta [Steroidobacteraceae bacterium]|jgi:formate dehydrogenase subunit delta